MSTTSSSTQSLSGMATDPPPSWVSPPNTQLDAHHKMLHEAALFGAHLRLYEQAVAKYEEHINDWFDAVDGFFVNVGYPSAWTYSPKVNPPPEEGGAAAPLPATSGGVTIVPAPIDLPKEHAPKFKYEVQRQLTADARQALTHVVHDRILHPIRFWFDVYERCKEMLPEVERLRKYYDARRAVLAAAEAKVRAAEAAAPVELLPPEGVHRPLQQDLGGSTAPKPAMEERSEMYKKEEEFTDIALEFETEEQKLYHKLSWLVNTGLRLKGYTAHNMKFVLDKVADRDLPLSLLVPFPERLLAPPVAGGRSIIDLIIRDHEQLRALGRSYRDAVNKPNPAGATTAAAPTAASTEKPGEGKEESKGAARGVLEADAGRRQMLTWQLIHEISVHAGKEEEVLYPAIEEKLGAQIANQLRCDHHELKQMLVTLGRKSAEDADFDDLVINVLDKLQQHMKEEEDNDLTKLATADGVDDLYLQELGAQYLAAADHVPTRPHPSAPDKPPLNLLTNRAAAVMDRAADMARFGTTAPVV
eukprot:jgi/Chrzof1/6346/Cz18g05050.t1